MGTLLDDSDRLRASGAAGGVPAVSQDQVLNGAPVSGSKLLVEDSSADRSVSFRLLSEIGRGGMGVVYRAEQIYPKRIVALKVIKGAIADSHARGRFEREIEIQARLSHRGIAQLYFAGLFDQAAGGASPFIAMEWVDGMPLMAYAEHHDLSVEARVRLFIRLCEIISYAHRQGVVHRDLKPSNVLVDRNGQPKVLDFGLSGGLGEAHDAQLTVPGQLMGTLEYMSPEQAEGRTAEVDERSDLFGLGVLLYQLLARRLPLEVTGKSVTEAVRIIKETTPPRLSVANRLCRGDLETITRKALSKDRLGRFQTADMFADDLNRWLEHEPIHARKPSAWYLVNKFLRRNWAFVTSVALIILALSIGLVMAALSAVEANQATNRAVDAQRAAEVEKRIAEAALASAEAARRDAVLENARKSVALGDALFHQDDFIGDLASYADARQKFAALGESTRDADLGIWQHDLLSALKIRVLMENGGGAGCFTISPNQGLIALGMADGTVEIRDVLTNNQLPGFKLTSNVNWVEFSPNSRLLMAWAGEQYAIWSLTEGRMLEQRTDTTINVDVPQRVYIAKMGDDRIVYAKSDLVMVEAPDGSRIIPPVQIPRGGLRTMTLNGAELLCITKSWDVMQVSTDTGNVKTLGHLPFTSENVASLSPDGDLIMVVQDSGMRIFERSIVDEGGYRLKFADPTYGPIGGCGLIDRKSMYATRSNSRTLDILDFDGRRIKSIPLTGRNNRAFVSRDLAIVKSAAPSLDLFSIAPTPRARVLIGSGRLPHGNALSSDGWMAARATSEDGIALYETTGGHLLRKIPMGGEVRWLEFNSEANLLLVGTPDSVVLWDVLRNQQVYRETVGSIACFSISEKSDLVVYARFLGDGGGCMRLTANGWKHERFSTQGLVANVQISDDSKRFILFKQDRKTEVWRVDDSYIPEGSLAEACAAGNPVLRPPRRFFPIAYQGQGIHVWDTASGLDTGTLGNISPDSLRFGACDADVAAVIDSDSLCLFDLKSRELLRRVSLSIGWADRISMSRDGAKILVSGSGGTMFLDFEVPEWLAALGTSPVAGALAGDENRIELAHRFVDVGLLDPELRSYEAQKPRILDSGSLRSGYIYWAAKDFDAAEQIFKASHELSEFKRDLLISAIQEDRQSMKR